MTTVTTVTTRPREPGGGGPSAAVEKLLPQNVEAEGAVLGALLIDPEAIEQVADMLRPGDFYTEAHRAIYAAALELYTAGEPADLIVLTDELARRGKLEEVGGLSYVSALANQVPTSRNVRHYAEIVVRTAILRRLIHAAGQIAGVAYGEPDADAALEQAERFVLEVANDFGARLGVGISGGRRRLERRSLADWLDVLTEETLARMDASKAPGIQTGFELLDQQVLGFEPGDLVYIAGRPGSGKSALGLALGTAMARQLAGEGRGVVEAITIEMRGQAQARRLVATQTHQNTRLIRSGFRLTDGRDDIDMDAWQRFNAQVQALKSEIGERVYITQGVPTLAQVRQLLTRAVQRHGARVALIDQLDLIAYEERSEFERITQMSRELKQIAQDLGIVLICLVQLSRKCEERRNKRPMLSDLRQSGQLEQDADWVLGLYRPAYYDRENRDPRFQRFAELLLLKAREDESGVMVPLQFERESVRFSDWPVYEQIPEDPTRKAVD